MPRLHSNRIAVGWMFRTEGIPRYIKVSIEGSELDRTFTDNEAGAKEAADWVTQSVGRDDWKLEDMAFLGFRIVVPAEPETDKATSVGAAVTYAKAAEGRSERLKLTLPVKDPNLHELWRKLMEAVKTWPDNEQWALDEAIGLYADYREVNDYQGFPVGVTQ